MFYLIFYLKYVYIQGAKKYFLFKRSYIKIVGYNLNKMLNIKLVKSVK